jgi:hypothetical protein
MGPNTAFEFATILDRQHQRVDSETHDCLLNNDEKPIRTYANYLCVDALDVLQIDPLDVLETLRGDVVGLEMKAAVDVSEDDFARCAAPLASRSAADS